MRIINLRIDEVMFNKMKRDKELKGIPNWEAYIKLLFFKVKK